MERGVGKEKSLFDWNLCEGVFTRSLYYFFRCVIRNRAISFSPFVLSFVDVQSATIFIVREKILHVPRAVPISYFFVFFLFFFVCASV